MIRMSEALPKVADRPQLRRWLRFLALLQALGLAAAILLLQRRGMPAGAALGWVLGSWALVLWLSAAGGFAVKALHGDWPASARGARDIATLLVESAWMLRLFLYDMSWRAAPMQLEPGDRRAPVLLVHGFLCNGAVWRPLEGELRAAGLRYAAVSLQPSYRDFERQLADLRAAVDWLRARSGHDRVLLVGHSMGGLLVRAFAASSPQLVAGAIMVAAPHHGTALGDLIHGIEGGPPSPRARWLQDFNRHSDERLPVPALNLWSGDDNIVVPAASSALRGVAERRTDGYGHMALIAAHDARLALSTAILDLLKRLEQAA